MVPLHVARVPVDPVATPPLSGQRRPLQAAPAARQVAFQKQIRPNRDPHADPTETELQASIHGMYAPCASVEGLETCDPERPGRCWWLEGVMKGGRHLRTIPALIGGRMGDLTRPSPRSPYHYVCGGRAVATSSRKPPPRPYTALRTNSAKICGGTLRRRAGHPAGASGTQPARIGWSGS